jgi:hypothetical protein
MPFRLWANLVQYGKSLFLGPLFRIFGRHLWAKIISTGSIYLLVALALTGAVLGFLMLFERLKMKCPICSRYSEVGGGRDGMWLDCQTCGVIHARFGVLRATFLRELPDGQTVKL